MKLDHPDYRRAVALIAHAASASAEGIEALIAEAVDAGRATELLRALLAAYGELAGQLRTEAGLTGVAELITAAAGHDRLGVAARVTAAYRTRDLGALNRELTAANEARPAELLGAVCELHAGLLPELGAPTGLAAVRRWAARLADLEHGGRA